MIYFFVQYFCSYLFFILFIVLAILFDLFLCPIFFCLIFLEVQTYNLFYFILIFCIQITSSFSLFCWSYFFVQYIFRYSFIILFIVIFFRYLFFVLLFVFCLIFFKVQTWFILFYLFVSRLPAVFSYLIWFISWSNTFFRYLFFDNQQFLPILFDLFLCPVFFLVTYFLFSLLFFFCRTFLRPAVFTYFIWFISLSNIFVATYFLFCLLF